MDTIDTVQGQDREVVLASSSVSDPDCIVGEAQVLFDPQCFDVTLTGARTRFIARLSESFLGHLPADQEKAVRAGDIQLFVLDHGRRIPVWGPSGCPTVT